MTSAPHTKTWKGFLPNIILSARACDAREERHRARVTPPRIGVGTAFVEVYQDCNVFNHDAFLYASDKTVKADNVVYLEHGKPLVFGKDVKKGIRLNGMHPEIVELGKACSGAQDLGKVSFGSEAALFHNAGIPAIICGPGRIAQAHQPNEWVTLEQLALCEAFMRRLADRVCVA